MSDWLCQSSKLVQNIQQIFKRADTAVSYMLSLPVYGADNCYRRDRMST